MPPTSTPTNTIAATHNTHSSTLPQNARRRWRRLIATTSSRKRLPTYRDDGRARSIQNARYANDAAATLAVIVGSGSKAAGAERLPRAMIDGYLGAVPQGQPTLRAALAKRPKVLATVGHLLDPFAER